MPNNQTTEGEVSVEEITEMIAQVKTQAPHLKRITASGHLAIRLNKRGDTLELSLIENPNFSGLESKPLYRVCYVEVEGPSEMYPKGAGFIYNEEFFAQDDFLSAMAALMARLSRQDMAGQYSGLGKQPHELLAAQRTPQYAPRERTLGMGGRT